MSDDRAFTKSLLFLLGCLAVLLAVSPAWAVPVSVTHQGRLLNADGEAMEGQAELTFTLYDAETDGAVLWQDVESVELGEDGFYSVVLGGEENPIDSQKLEGGDVWIGLQVDGGEELKPRIPVTSVPFAIRAQTAETAESLEGNVGWDQVDSVPQDLGDGDDDTTYSGDDFAVSDQQCPDGEVAVAVDASGNLTCAPDQDSETTYTGGGGININNKTVSLGSQACGAGQVAVGVDGSGRFICGNDQNTTYSSGTGLNLNGTTFSLDTSFTDGRYAKTDQSCPSGEVVVGLNANGTVKCATDQDSGGDITRVNTTTGVKGGGLSGSVDIEVDYSETQKRVDGSCSDGEVMVGVNEDGSVECEQAGESSSYISSTSGSCGSFKPLQTCPLGDNSGPGCDEVGIGGLCEGGTTCGLNGSLNNCGIYEWFIKTGN